MTATPGQRAYEAGPLGWVSRGIWPPVPWEELTPQDHAWWDRVAQANDPWPDWALLADARQEAADARQEAAAVTAELAALRVLRAVAGHFTGTWAELMTALPDDYGCEMNCGEANAAADLYRALGLDATAGAIIAAHAGHDDDEERATHREDGD